MVVDWIPGTGIETAALTPRTATTEDARLNAHSTDVALSSFSVFRFFF
jgi:hypothetical protein